MCSEGIPLPPKTIPGAVSKPLKDVTPVVEGSRKSARSREAPSWQKEAMQYEEAMKLEKKTLEKEGEGAPEAKSAKASKAGKASSIQKVEKTVNHAAAGAKKKKRKTLAGGEKTVTTTSESGGEEIYTPIQNPELESGYEGVYPSPDLPGFWCIKLSPGSAKRGLAGGRGYYPTPEDAAVVYCREEARNGGRKQRSPCTPFNNKGSKSKGKADVVVGGGGGQKRDLSETEKKQGDGPSNKRARGKKEAPPTPELVQEQVLAGVAPLDALGSNRVITKEMLRAQFVSMSEVGPSIINKRTEKVEPRKEEAVAKEKEEPLFIGPGGAKPLRAKYGAYVTLSKLNTWFATESFQGKADDQDQDQAGSSDVTIQGAANSVEPVPGSMPEALTVEQKPTLAADGSTNVKSEVLETGLGVNILSGESFPAADANAVATQSSTIAGELKQEENQIQAPVEEEPTFCMCNSPDDGMGMIGCDSCEDWCHLRCVGVDPEEAESITQFNCPTCADKDGKPFQFLDRLRGIHEVNSIGRIKLNEVECTGPVTIEEAAVKEGLAAVRRMPSQVYAYLDFLEAQVEAAFNTEGYIMQKAVRPIKGSEHGVRHVAGFTIFKLEKLRRSLFVTIVAFNVARDDLEAVHAFLEVLFKMEGVEYVEVRMDPKDRSQATFWDQFGFKLSSGGAVSKNISNEVARRYTNNGHKRTTYDEVMWSDGGTPLVFAGCTPDKAADMVRRLMADEQGMKWMYMLRQLEGENARGLVVRVATVWTTGGIAGLIAARVTATRRVPMIDIRCICVKRNYRRRNVGKAVVTHMLSWVAEAIGEVNARAAQARVILPHCMQVSSKFWGRIGFDISAGNVAILRNLDSFRVEAENCKKRPQKERVTRQPVEKVVHKKQHVEAVEKDGKGAEEETQNEAGLVDLQQQGNAHETSLTEPLPEAAA